MLKNVAIPLMLAATEAEAQNWLKEALEADEESPLAGFAAPAAACTPAADSALAALQQETKSAQAAVDSAQEDVDALKAVDGAWALAVKARDEAVKAAADEEAEADVAAKLDALDAAYAAERAAARAAVTAAAALAVGQRRADAAQTRNEAAVQEEARLKGLRDAAVTAVATAKAQHAKELLWQEWLYCELGAVPAGLSDYSDWWKAILSDSQINSANTAPTFCTVPEVLSDLDANGDAVQDADGNTLQTNGQDRVAVVLRPAVKFYSDKTNLASEAEPTDGSAWQKWTAQLTLDMAECNVNYVASCAQKPGVTQGDVTETLGGNAYTRAGAVAYRTGDFRAKTWVKNQRTYELGYYNEVNGYRATAQGWTNTLTTDNAHDVSAGAGANYGYADGSGTLKDLEAKATARTGYATLAEVGAGTLSAGATYRLAAARTAGSNDDAWKMTWAVTAASMEAWWDLNDAGNGGTAGAVWSWWDKAKDVSEAASAWHAKWATDNAEMALNGMIGSEVQTTASQSAHCTVATGAGNGPNGGTWTAQTDANAADKDGCKTKCEQHSIDGLLVDMDANGVDNGGKTSPVYEAAGSYCGAYSYETGGAGDQKCYILVDGHTAVINAGDAQGNAADFCYNYTEMAGAGNWSVLQTAVKTAWDALITGSHALHTGLVGQAEAQATLEKDWLEAWLLQQYWVSIDSELQTGTANSLSAALEAKRAAVSDNSDDQNTATELGATTAANTADTALQTATTTLTGLQASVATAQAAVDEFGSRLTRAAAELLELKTLVQVDANAGSAGELDDVATKRTEVYDAYSKADAPKGEFTLAAEEKAAADEAIKARDGTNDNDGNPNKNGGALWEADFERNAEWDTAKQDVIDKNGELTGALDGADLVALRQAVTDKTGLWTQQNVDLAGLVSTLEGKQDDLNAAEKAQAAAVLACQLKAYDEYRTALEDELVKRAEALVKIKALLEKAEAEKPAPGQAGARCEKALSNGTFRPARGETTCAEGLCCGAARVWMSAGAGVANAAWRTVETCQLETATKFEYQPARAPMATTLPAKVEVDFACIEGAKQLAAAASALAAAVYMLA